MPQLPAHRVRTALIHFLAPEQSRVFRNPVSFWIAVAIGLLLIVWSALLLPFVSIGRAIPDPATAPDHERTKQQ